MSKRMYLSKECCPDCKTKLKLTRMSLSYFCEEYKKKFEKSFRYSDLDIIQYARGGVSIPHTTSVMWGIET